MAGVSAEFSGVSAPKSGVDADLMLIYQGGANFLQRMTAFSAAKEAAEGSLAELQLGKDTVAAHAEALAKQAQATETLEQAKRNGALALQKANAQAAEIVAAANAEYERIIAEARALHAEADGKHKAASETLTSARAESARMTTEITGLRDQVNAELAAAQKKSADADVAKSAHGDAKAKAERLAKSLTGKIDKLHAAIEQARASE